MRVRGLVTSYFVRRLKLGEAMMDTRWSATDRRVANGGDLGHRQSTKRNPVRAISQPGLQARIAKPLRAPPRTMAAQSVRSTMSALEPSSKELESSKCT